MSSDDQWITLDYIELYCEKNHIVVGCAHGEDQLWISALGPHPSTLRREEVHEILADSALFEIRPMTDDQSSPPDSTFLTRTELEQRLRKMMN